MAPHGGVLEVAAQQTGDGGRRKEFDGFAAIVASCEARLTFVADNVGLDGDAISDFKVLDRLMDSHYHSGRLVTENVGVFYDHGANASLKRSILFSTRNLRLQSPRPRRDVPKQKMTV